MLNLKFLNLNFDLNTGLVTVQFHLPCCLSLSPSEGLHVC